VGQLVILNFCFATERSVVGKMRDLILQLSKSSIYSTKPPMAVVLSIILPGNRVLPFVDLASLMFLLAMVTPF
jgi:galactitol-specific phosphotransferase system IIC component